MPNVGPQGSLLIPCTVVTWHGWHQQLSVISVTDHNFPRLLLFSTLPCSTCVRSANDYLLKFEITRASSYRTLWEWQHISCWGCTAERWYCTCWVCALTSTCLVFIPPPVMCIESFEVFTSMPSLFNKNGEHASLWPNDLLPRPGKTTAPSLVEGWQNLMVKLHSRWSSPRAADNGVSLPWSSWIVCQMLSNFEQVT